MRKLKKKDIVLIIAGIIFLLLLAFIGFRILPKNRMIKEIAQALQPVIEAENQFLHLKLDGTVDDKEILLDSDIYLITDQSQEYVIAKMSEIPIYITDNLLIFENGKAFRISNEMEGKIIDYKGLLSHISKIYGLLDIACEKTEEETTYKVQVTGEELDKLLNLLPVEYEAIENIEELQLTLVTRENKLSTLEFYGRTVASDKKVELHLDLSGFKELAAGSYVIPEAVSYTVKNVDRASLLTLTEDLYRLIVAASKFEQEEAMTGMVYVKVDCGILHLNSSVPLKNLLDGSSNSKINLDKEKMLEIILYLCIEGNLSCAETKEGYRYELQLGEDVMQSIVSTFVPELVNHVVTIQNGSSYLILKEEDISTIHVNIDGNITVLMAEILASIDIEMCFK